MTIMDSGDNQLIYLRSMREFLRECQDLRNDLRGINPGIDLPALRPRARTLAQRYFNDLEPKLVERKMEIDDLHKCLGRLLVFSGRRLSKKIYLKNIERAMDCLKDHELRRIVSMAS